MRCDIVSKIWFPFFSFGFYPHLVVFRAFSWFCAQELLLVGLRSPDVVLGIKPRFIPGILHIVLYLGFLTCHVCFYLLFLFTGKIFYWLIYNITIFHVHNPNTIPSSVCSPPSLNYLFTYVLSSLSYLSDLILLFILLFLFLNCLFFWWDMPDGAKLFLSLLRNYSWQYIQGARDWAVIGCMQGKCPISWIISLVPVFIFQIATGTFLINT